MRGAARALLVLDRAASIVATEPGIPRKLFPEVSQWVLAKGCMRCFEREAPVYPLVGEGTFGETSFLCPGMTSSLCPGVGHSLFPPLGVATAGICSGLTLCEPCCSFTPGRWVFLAAFGAT